MRVSELMLLAWGGTRTTPGAARTRAHAAREWTVEEGAPAPAVQSRPSAAPAQPHAPEPMHMDTTPKRAALPRRCISYSSVAVCTGGGARSSSHAIVMQAGHHIKGSVGRGHALARTVPGRRNHACSDEQAPHCTAVLATGPAPHLARPSAAQRVAQRNGAAVRVHPIHVQPQLVHRVGGLQARAGQPGCRRSKFGTPGGRSAPSSPMLSKCAAYGPPRRRRSHKHMLHPSFQTADQ